MAKTPDYQDSFKNILDFKGLKIKLASPEGIRAWSHGEITKPETINYRTLKPEKDGLFDERIFGPVKDWECYCGKYKRIRYKGIICDKCGVEVTQSRVRRERMGHISLASPVAHVWYFKGAPSKLSLLLDVSPKALESVIYFAQYIVTHLDEKKRTTTLQEISKAAQAQKDQLKKDTEAKIADLQKSQKGDAKELKSAELNEDTQAIAMDHLSLKNKQVIQSLRDAEIAESDQIATLYQRLSDIVKNVTPFSILTEEEYTRLASHQATDFFEVGMGAEAILEVVKQIDLPSLTAQLREEVSSTTGQRHIKATKRLRVTDGLRRAEVDPTWMLLKILPVIPPDLRPMVQLSGGRFATSDLNDLYRRVINRNHRLKHLMDLGAPDIILRNEKRMLQEAVDSLIDSAQHTTRNTRANTNRPRSLSDMLRGKQGRFRQNLLGKRVDYSGRSVIVVGPELKLSQCGLPKEMALEMFKPHVLRQMIVQGLAPNVKSAKNLLESRPPEVFDILEEITKNHPVLLNRAPTLHKLSIQAFYPILIEGSAIRIHPCICSGFNADFDGDQMAVHVPISVPAIHEASTMMMAENNLRKPADGTPITIPSTKEMALGNYYLTSIDSTLDLYPSVLSNSVEAVLAFHSQRLHLRQKVNVKINSQIIETTVGRILFNEVLPAELRFINEPVRRGTIVKLFNKAFKLYESGKIVELIDKIKDLGFWAGTISGLSASITDSAISPQKDEAISQGNKQVAEISQNYTAGLITIEERKRLSQEVWMELTETIADMTWKLIEPHNPLFLMVDAQVGRVSKEQIKQLSGMRGLVVDPLGQIVDLPIKGNYRQGLSPFEYVNVARGERKGLSDTSIRTADAGYLTRRLVDVAHDAIIRLEDCETTSGITISVSGSRSKAYTFRLFGRFTTTNVVSPKSSRKVIIPAGTLLDESHLAQIESESISEVTVRSPLTCNARYGLCAKCYGISLTTMSLAQVGDPVGIVAAQSIGEPGTQMTLHGKRGSTSAGGIDVTQGLPRVEELFESRTPKMISALAEISGKVEVSETETGYKIRIRNTSVKPVEEKEYLLPLTAQIRVAEGDLVTAGSQLAEGSLDIKEVLEVRGLRGAQEYLVEEIQAVYESQGITIHDKHFEVIVRKMSDRVRIISSGDTTLLPGDIVDRAIFEIKNARTLAEGGEPSTAQVVVLGITRAALKTISWLSAASFIQTTSELADSAIEGRSDPLLGLKENVIIGRLIPTDPDRARLDQNAPMI